MKRFAAIFSLILATWMLCPVASASLSSKLSEIMAKIKNVTAVLHQHKNEQLTAEKKLQQTELAINNVSLQLHALDTQLSNHKQVLNRLLAEEKRLESKIAHEQGQLLMQLKFAYTMGLKKTQAEILLQGEDHERISRLLMYNRYFTLKNQQTITHLKADLLNLSTSKQAIIEQTNRLAALKKKQSMQQQALDSNKSNQRMLLQQLAEKVKTQTQQLQDLVKNKQQLENLVKQLEKKKAYESEFLTHHSGRFPWPTQGKISERFGSSIQHSELKQSGVVIKAPEGQKVYAVAPGKVVFANWLPGYGLLTIIDHGKGYMTLYGNNKVLYKKTNDLVGNHELIAQVGHTGGTEQASLYFALRYNGKAIDPCTWCGK